MYSILGLQFLIKIFTSRIYGQYGVLIALLSAIFALGFLFRKFSKTSWLLKREDFSDLGKEFILKPIIESVSEDEMKNAMIELSSFMRFLHEKNIYFELSFVSMGSRKPFIIKLNVHSNDTNIHDFVKTNFKLFCKKWSLADKSSITVNTKVLPFTESPFF